jgi:hypothetical protein
MAGFVGQVAIIDEDGIELPVEAVLTGEHAADERLAWWEGMIHTTSPHIHTWDPGQGLTIRVPGGSEEHAIIEKVQLATTGGLAIATIRGLGNPPFG